MSRSRDGMLLTTRSPIRSSPSEMSSRPATMRRAVVLPQPDGPTSTTNSPSSIPRSTWLTARVPSGYTFETPSNETPATFLLPPPVARPDHKRIAVVPRNYLDKLTSALAAALDGSLRAVYLTGSAAVDRYRAGDSDLDVLVAAESASRDQLEQIVATCSHDVLPCPATKLELVVYEIDELAAPHVPPRWSLNFDTGEATHQVDWDPETQPSHWFVLDLAFAHRHAQPLVGSAVIGEPEHEEIERAFEELLAWFEANEPDALPVARMRAEHWSRTGTFMPKPGLPST